MRHLHLSTACGTLAIAQGEFCNIKPARHRTGSLKQQQRTKKHVACTPASVQALIPVEMQAAHNSNMSHSRTCSTTRAMLCQAQVQKHNLPSCSQADLGCSPQARLLMCRVSLPRFQQTDLVQGCPPYGPTRISQE